MCRRMNEANQETRSGFKAEGSPDKTCREEKKKNPTPNCAVDRGSRRAGCLAKTSARKYPSPLGQVAHLAAGSQGITGGEPGL